MSLSTNLQLKWWRLVTSYWTNFCKHDLIWGKKKTLCSKVNKLFNSADPTWSLLPKTQEILKIIWITINNVTINQTGKSWWVLYHWQIISPLIFIINKMLTSRKFPSRLKYSQITPIFKKGIKTDIAAYRPISLLLHFQKYLKRRYSTDLSNMYTHTE